MRKRRKERREAHCQKRIRGVSRFSRALRRVYRFGPFFRAEDTLVSLRCFETLGQVIFGHFVSKASLPFSFQRGITLSSSNPLLQCCCDPKEERDPCFSSPSSLYCYLPSFDGCLLPKRKHHRIRQPWAKTAVARAPQATMCT